MKGVLLAGGKGTRLFDCTKVVNKHLVRVYDRPMIEAPIASLKSAGIQDVMVITGVEHGNTVFEYLGSGERYGMRFVYGLQDKAGGIAEALALAESFVGGENCFVLLGDNIFDYDFSSAVNMFTGGAKVFLKQVKDPHRFGIAEIDMGKIISIEEKPAHPKTNLAVTGAYIFDSTVFDKIRKCVYSGRGELEITDVNNQYIQEGKMTYEPIDGFWSDAGTIESIHICEQYYFNKQRDSVKRI
jgi:glucose-1-phosphate thymidylyltransferase